MLATTELPFLKGKGKAELNNCNFEQSGILNEVVIPATKEVSLRHMADTCKIILIKTSIGVMKNKTEGMSVQTSILSWNSQPKSNLSDFYLHHI